MTCQNCGHTLPPSVKFCPKCGTPVMPVPYQPPDNRLQTSWTPQPILNPPKRKSRLGKILLILFSIFLVIVIGAGVAAYFGYRYLEKTLKNSEAYRMAEISLKQNKEVAERLGEIKSTGFPLGTYEEKAGGTGNAVFYMSVEGAKASGQYFVTMERENSKWRISRAFIKLPHDEVINIVGSSEEPGSGGQSGDKSLN